MKRINKNQIEFIRVAVESFVGGMDHANQDDIQTALDAAMNALDEGMSGSTAYAIGARAAINRIKERRAKAVVIYMTDRIKRHTPALQAG